VSRFKAVRNRKAHQSSSLSPISVDPIIDSAKLIHDANNEAGGILRKLTSLLPVLFCHGLSSIFLAEELRMPKRLLGEVAAVAIGQGQIFRLEDYDGKIKHYRHHRLVMAYRIR